tara:strand:+ start:1616 stop:2347 length:732 start_codon:yes stop_codon:yes gene_type:complete
MPMNRSDAALFSSETYNMLGSDSKVKRIKGINKRIQKTGYEVDRKNSNRDILTLVNPVTKSVHIAHRGTNITTPTDLSADLSIATGHTKSNKLFKNRTKKTEKALEAFPDHYASISGHSLGGTSAYRSLLASSKVRERIESGFTYNMGATIFKDGPQDLSKDDISNLKDKLTHHRVSGDPVSASTLVQKPIGKVKTYRPKQKTFTENVTDVALSNIPFLNLTRDGLNNHSLDHFYDKTKYHDE